MSNPAESLEYIKCYSSSSPRPINNPSNSIRQNYQKICWRLRRPETILKARKKDRFFHLINKLIIYKFFNDFTNHQKKIKRAVVSSYMLKITDLSAILETSFLQKRVQLVCMKVQEHSSLEPPLKYNQDQTPLTNQGFLWPF